MLPPIPDPLQYDVTPDRGFLCPTAPLCVLPDQYYAPWEKVVRNLQPLILAKRLRAVIDELPILSTDRLRDEGEWRRAHSILSFFAHGYIWGGDKAEERVPPSISVPFLATCDHFELPPVATYASVVLWNYRAIFDDEPVDSLANVASIITFTGSTDESWFYLVSVAIEAKAAPIIPMMLDAVEAARQGGEAGSVIVAECLQSFAERLDELGALLQRMYESCDPHFWYHRIRPFLAGSKNMAAAGLPRGVCFDDGSGNSKYVQLAGGSNAQSSIIQFFDIILGVEHRPTQPKPPSRPSAQGSQVLASSDSDYSSSTTSVSTTSTVVPARRRGSTHNFILDMRNYMPGPHRRFLEQVSRVANIRDFVNSRTDDRALVTAYDASLAMLRTFRDKHMQMVSRYIVIKSREARHNRERSLSTSGGDQGIKRPLVGTKAASEYPTAKGPGRRTGTGGTALIPFLKQARDETGEPAVDAWTQRLLSSGPFTYRIPGAELDSNHGIETFKAAAKARTAAVGGATMTKLAEHASGEIEVVGLAGTWSIDDTEGGICHW